MRWESEKIVCVKYVDDCLAIEKVCFQDSLRGAVGDGDVAIVRAMQRSAY